MRRLVLVGVLAAACVGFVDVGTAKAIGPCGTVTQNTVLQDDCLAPLLVAANGITVDLNNHSVICSGGLFGVALFSRSFDVVRNGQIMGCIFGVFSQGGGSHQFVSLRLENNTIGVELDDSGSFVRLSTFSGNTVGVGDQGFRSTTRRNSFTNTVVPVALNGFLGTASENRILGGVVGIEVVGDGNTVFLNSVLGAALAGIEVFDEANGNRIQSNAVFGSGGFDMQDDNQNCDSNSWAFNAFGTRNQTCIH